MMPITGFLSCTALIALTVRFGELLEPPTDFEQLGNKPDANVEVDNMLTDLGAIIRASSSHLVDRQPDNAGEIFGGHYRWPFESDCARS